MPARGDRPPMNLTIQQLKRSAEIAEIMAAFEKPIDQVTRKFLLETGLDHVRVVGCLKWLWFQWLLNGAPSLVRDRVAAFVADEITRLNLSPQFDERPRHNLLLLHCAIFASSQA